jgi:hypothetical protein
MWCIPDVSTDYVAAMEDVLDLYEEPYDEKRPMVCFDESPYQLIAETRKRIPAAPGRPERFDVEYERNGVRDLMMISEPKLGLRKVLVTERRTKIEFADTMKHIAQMYPDAEVVRVVLDNLNTHKKASLYDAFPPEEARAIARKLEFHYTPKHGSWLNMAEMEFSVLARTCLAGRVPNENTLRKRINANVSERNAKLQPINWRFTIRDARKKLHRLYPSQSE